jgi:hypothetical protein
MTLGSCVAYTEDFSSASNFLFSAIQPNMLMSIWSDVAAPETAKINIGSQNI